MRTRRRGAIEFHTSLSYHSRGGSWGMSSMVFGYKPSELLLGSLDGVPILEPPAVNPRARRFPQEQVGSKRETDRRTRSRPSWSRRLSKLTLPSPFARLPDEGKTLHFRPSSLSRQALTLAKHMRASIGREGKYCQNLGEKVWRARR